MCKSVFERFKGEDMDTEYITLKQARAELPLSVFQIRRYMANGEIAGYLGEKRVLLEKKSFDDFVSSKTVPEDPKYLLAYYEKHGHKPPDIKLSGGVDKWITIKEAQQILPLSYSYIKNLINNRQIKACILSKRIFIRESSFRQHIAMNYVSTRPKESKSEEKVVSQEKNEFEEKNNKEEEIKIDEN